MAEDTKGRQVERVREDYKRRLLASCVCACLPRSSESNTTKHTPIAPAILVNLSSPNFAAMSSKPAVRRSAGPKLSQEKPVKKAKLDVKEARTKPRQATPPPKPRKAQASAEELPAIPASAKGKGKAREDVSVLTTPQEASTSSLPTSFKIVTGSYEKLLYGLDGQVAVHDSEYSFKLKPIFIFPAHISCIKAVAASPEGGKWLATGSADEIIKVWDLRRRKEIGGLMHHEGMLRILLVFTVLYIYLFHRVNHASPVPLPLSSIIRLRRRNPMSISRARLGSLTSSERP